MPKRGAQRQRGRLPADTPPDAGAPRNPAVHDTGMTAVKAGGKRSLGVFLVALEKLDRDALRPADEADAHPRPDRRRLPGELDALGPDFGGHPIDVLYPQPEIIEPW